MRKVPIERKDKAGVPLEVGDIVEVQDEDVNVVGVVEEDDEGHLWVRDRRAGDKFPSRARLVSRRVTR